MTILAPAPPDDGTVTSPVRTAPGSDAPEPTRTSRRTSVPFAVRQVLLLATAVLVYFAVRSLTTGSVPTAERNADLVVGLERRLGIFAELDLQRFALGFDGVLPVVNAIYIWGHWPVIVAVMGWLAWRRREAFLVYRNALLLSGLVGMVIVATFPVAPPRLMDLGFLDTVTSHTESYRLMQPPSLTNQYAAMPSFHVGWDLLVGIALVRETRSRWLHWAGRLLPVAMVLTVVVTGNHYFLDAVVGDAIVLAALYVAWRWSPGVGTSRSIRRRQRGVPSASKWSSDSAWTRSSGERPASSPSIAS